jgi:hypothetical protein
MAQLAIYLDKETARLLAEAARRDGVSRSALARRAIRSHLHRRLPDSFFEALGGWEDGRSAEEILLSLRTGPDQKERTSLE